MRASEMAAGSNRAGNTLAAAMQVAVDNTRTPVGGNRMA